jgi:hypothetical protein
VSATPDRLAALVAFNAEMARRIAEEPPDRHLPGCYCCPECSWFSRVGRERGPAAEAAARDLVARGREMAGDYPPWGTEPDTLAGAIDAALERIAHRTEVADG